MEKGKQFEDPTHMTARDIVSKHEPGDLIDWETNHGWDEERPTPEYFWYGKYQEAVGNGLRDSIAEKGYTAGDEPITISKTYGILDGHHRIAVMLFRNPDMPLPVTFED